MPRNLIITLIALVALAAIVWPIAKKRMKKEHKIDQLDSELRLFETQIQTGVNYTDFLTQFAKVRTAHLAAADAMTPDLDLEYGKLDLCVKACGDFWKTELHQNGTVISTADLLRFFARFGIAPKLTSPDYHPQIFDSAFDCVTQLQERIVQDINAFLKSQPCPWPQGGPDL